MQRLRVALLQLLAEGTDQEANVRKGEAACRDAASLGADIALFPEMWNIGYYGWSEAGDGPEELSSRSIDRTSPFIDCFRLLAVELDMAIAITYLERWSPAPRNAVSLIDRHGKLALTYAKVHTCDFGDEAMLTPGEGFPVATLNTHGGAVRIGAMICFDLLFPEAARALMLGGAEVIIVPNASRNDANHLLCLRARAHENMVAVALSNYAAPQQTGRSIAFDGVSYDIDPDMVDAPVLDPTLAAAGKEEGIVLADIDLERLRRFREAETQGDAYRKPYAYGALVGQRAVPPFERDDARRARLP